MKKDTSMLIAQVVCVLYDKLKSGQNFMPSSYLMLALKMEMDEYFLLLRLLKTVGYITYTNETVKLTEKGEKMGEKLTAMLAE